MKVIRDLIGYSGAQVKLIEDEGRLSVRKTGKGVRRNISRMQTIQYIVPLPALYSYNNSDKFQENDSMNMEYIPNLDMGSYLLNENWMPLAQFLNNVLMRLDTAGDQSYKDYSAVYEQKLAAAEYKPTTAGKLMDLLPRKLRRSAYHGDLTLENVLYRYTDGEFFCIDCVDSDYDSAAFDIAKLRQDIDCGWFLRNRGLLIDHRLQAVSHFLRSRWVTHGNNNALAILMLMRVMPYATPEDKKWLAFKMDWLWKAREGAQ